MRIIQLLIIVIFSKSILFAQSPSVELRGAWVATVANIDWPSAQNLKVGALKKEINSILDFYKEHNFNSVFVQVRPSADTFYPSKYEPWSKYLSGEQGKRPGWFFNPLNYWIKESHKRGIEFHAWINPYRITNNKNEILAKDHPANLHPDWVVAYGGKKYYNPGLEECRKHITQMVSEIVNKYDVDGIHFDDYFYPYPVSGQNFPDSTTYEIHKNGSESIEDWRRDNINTTIKELYTTIKSADPTIKFGISPFGVWRNKSDDVRGSDTFAGITNYDHLYADIITWLKKGWIDYVTPQLYWSIENKAVPFELLTQWWSGVSSGRAVYVGHALYKLNGNKQEWKNPQELINQIKIVRKDSLTGGSIYFSHKHLLMNKLCFTDSLTSNLYQYPALIPAMPWINSEKPSSPRKLRLENSIIKWSHRSSAKSEKPILYAIYAIRRGGYRQLVLLSSKTKADVSKFLNSNEKLYGFQITAVSKTNNESNASNIVLLK